MNIESKLNCKERRRVLDGRREVGRNEWLIRMWESKFFI